MTQCSPLLDLIDIRQDPIVEDSRTFSSDKELEFLRSNSSRKEEHTRDVHFELQCVCVELHPRGACEGRLRGG
jgi:hypothetical protein